MEMKLPCDDDISDDYKLPCDDDISDDYMCVTDNYILSALLRGKITKKQAMWLIHELYPDEVIEFLLPLYREYAGTQEVDGKP
jgi:hypothetical protein